MMSTLLLVILHVTVCFAASNPMCDSVPTKRVDCGYAKIQQAGCENLGCCYNTKLTGIQCYKGMLNGGWSAWTTAACTVTCQHPGVDVVAVRTRACNNPAPLSGGADCVGSSTMTVACATDPPACPPVCDPSCNTCANASPTGCTSCKSPTVLSGTAPASCVVINGGWSAWTTGPCTVTCQSPGVNANAVRTRACNNPVPLGGGANCVGDSTMTVACATAPPACPPVCDPSCDTCANSSPTGCTSCKSPAILSGTVPASCIVCDPSCDTCANSSPTGCTSCKSPAILSGTVPASCIVCDLSCNTCANSSPTGCTSCKSPAILSGTVPASCIVCDSSCNTCANPSATGCTSCKSPTVLSGTAPASCVAPGCPADFTQVISSGKLYCYSVVSKLANWPDSYRACTARHPQAHLLTMNSVEETNNLRLPFESLTTAEYTACLDSWYWTAGQRANATAHPTLWHFWKYLDASGNMKFASPLSYTNWFSTYPAADPISTSVLINGDSSKGNYLTWATNAQTTNRCAVCEIDTIPPPISSQTVCPADFLQVRSSGKVYCYAMNAKKATWSDAYSACTARNPQAHLLTVNDKDETSILSLPFESLSAAEQKACSDWWYWTSGQTAIANKRTTQTYFWKNLDASGRVKYSMPVAYTNWLSNWPQNQENYTSILINGDLSSNANYLGWANNPTSWLRCSVCEIDILPPASLSPPPVCPPDFSLFQISGKLYCYAVITKPASWSDSYRACTARNPQAHLVEINNSDETKNLKLSFGSLSAAQQKGCWDSTGSAWYWTAGQTFDPNTHTNAQPYYWKNLDGSGKVNYWTPVTYTNWFSTWPNCCAQPSDTSILIGGESSHNYYMGWTSASTATLHCAVCEIDMQ